MSRSLGKMCGVVTVCMLLAAPAALATNGMNMEGYGPIACGMGGAASAFDNGTAGVMNNPATLALMAPGTRLDVALGRLGPNVEASVATPQGSLHAESLSDAFYMPALGLVHRGGRFAYGFGIFAQGGMGTEFDGTSWMSDPSQGADTALQSGMTNCSEVSVGRFLVPVTYDVSKRLHVGGTVDLVWAGMDLQMAMSEAQFVNLVTTQTIGTASGTLANAFGSMYEPFGGHGVSRLYHAYFDFTNDSPFTGEAKGLGVAGRLGAVYSVNPRLSVGAVYKSKTSMSDLETDNASINMGVRIDQGVAGGGSPTGTYMDAIIPVSGKITVKNFEWPETFGAGIAYKPAERLLLAVDVQRIRWSGVMKDFTMTFEADSVPANGGFAGLDLDATLFQDWQDQTAVSVGAAYDVSPRVQVRGGVNLSDNPIPDRYLNPLFPAIVRSHVSLGGGYSFGRASKVNLAVSRAFEAENTNPGDGSSIPAVTSTHSQVNMQLMFTQGF